MNLPPAGPPQAQNPAVRRRELALAMIRRTHEVLANQPEYFDAETLALTKVQTDRMRTKIKEVNDLIDKTPRNNPSFHHLLESRAQIRLEYDLRFWRLFRINDLPPEIILEILRYVCWSPGDGIRPREVAVSTCRLWRELALGDSMLWTALYFQMKDYPFKRCYQWLSRAGRAPLHIRFDDGEKAGERQITDAEMEEFLDVLLAQIYHIQSLIFIIRNWAPLLTFLKRLYQISRLGRPLILQRLEIHRSGDLYSWPGQSNPIEGHDITTYTVLGGPVTPILNWLSIDGVHFDWGASSISNLTTLDLRRLPLELAPSRKAFRAMLTGSPLLNRLTLDGAGPNEFYDANSQSPPIPLNHLKILILCNFSPIYTRGILQNFTAPNVQDLQIMCFMRNDYDEVWKTMAGAFPNVNLLSFLKVDLTWPSSMKPFARFLASMPKVRYLRMSPVTPGASSALIHDGRTGLPLPGIPAEHSAYYASCGVAMNVISYPTSSSTPTIIFPQLKVLEVQEMPLPDLVGVVESRRAIALPLARIYAKGAKQPMDSQTYQRILSNRCFCEPITMSQTTPEELLVLDEAAFRKFYRMDAP